MSSSASGVSEATKKSSSSKKEKKEKSSDTKEKKEKSSSKEKTAVDGNSSKKDRSTSSPKKERSSCPSKKERSSSPHKPREGKESSSKDKVEKTSKSGDKAKKRSKSIDKDKPSKKKDEKEKNKKESKSKSSGHDSKSSSEDGSGTHESTAEDEPKAKGSGRGLSAIEAFGFGGDAFGESFGADDRTQSSGESGAGRTATRQRLRARRASIGGVGGVVTSDSGVTSDEEEPKSCDNLEFGGGAGGRPMRRRARRVSVGHADAAHVANFVCGTKNTNSGSSDFGFDNHNGPPAVDASRGSGAFTTDFERKLPPRNDSGISAESDDPLGPGMVDPSARSNRKKLIDDIAFGSDFVDPGNNARGKSSAGFELPMMDAFAGGGDGSGLIPEGDAPQRRPRARRASLTLTSFGGNHQAMAMDEDDKKDGKTGFFKDRSGGTDKKSRAPPRPTMSNENLTGYDFDRDRRRFLG